VPKGEWPLRPLAQLGVWLRSVAEALEAAGPVGKTCPNLPQLTVEGIADGAPALAAAGTLLHASLR